MSRYPIRIGAADLEDAREAGRDFARSVMAWATDQDDATAALYQAEECIEATAANAGYARPEVLTLANAFFDAAQAEHLRLYAAGCCGSRAGHA
ncbi:hypothetical protein [Pseudoroseomonas sp. WGS1072]|uniref:hypothetical protein n=1 Tax=Roseomonas sp. WGS1072 TaxID=3366816 RepID=UPI003BF0AEE1